MPGLTIDPPPPIINPSSRGSESSVRKPQDKAIGGVFSYTNGHDVDTGLSDYHKDALKSLKSSSLHSTSKGVPNGSLKAPREPSHGKTDSAHSRNSYSRRSAELSSVNGTVDGESNNMDTAAEEMHGRQETTKSEDDKAVVSPKKQAMNPPSRNSENILQPVLTEEPLQMDDPERHRHLSVPGGPSRSSMSLVHRFSSPPGLVPGLLRPERQSSETSEAVAQPRLTHRHTLNIPKPPSTSQNRGSRDFSFGGGDEAAFASGRFSPSRDQEANTPRHRRASLGLIRRTTNRLHQDHADGVIPDEDAARWAEVIKQKRASRRKRREEEDDDRVVVGKKVVEGHVNWVTAYNMLTGIRFTVSRTNAKIDRELTDADFDARHKFSFDIMGTELTPSAKYDFKFKDYSPWVFRHLRTIFGLDPADYLMSLTSKYILSELGSPGKSGSFFYFSRDYKYIIKTIHHAEHKLLRKILRDYYQHVLENPNTLISQFYGLHRVKIPYGRKIHFVVMNNLFPPHRDIHQTFDLKGSTIGRDFREEDLASNPRATLKDLNWLRRDYHLQFNSRVKQLFVEQLQRDVALLQKLHIMDYSLLVGMHDLEKGNEENVRENMLRVFQPGGARQDDGQNISMLTRTPSRLENIRKAKELRMTLKKEKPVRMGLMTAKMPDQMSSGDERSNRIFYSDDGGIRATHEDGSKGDTIYYLGVIDCLTHYGILKRVEHYYKGLSSPRSQISPVPPQAYGDRFVNFITGITMTKEEADRRQTHETDRGEQTVPVLRPSLEQEKHSEQHVPSAGPSEKPPARMTPPGSPVAVERTMRKAQKQVDKATSADKGRRKSEDEKPDRTLTTALTSPEEPKTSAVLPIVSEAHEGNESPVLREKQAVDLPSVLEAPEKSRIDANGHEGGNGGIRQVSSSTAGIEAEPDADEIPTLSSSSTTDERPFTAGDQPIAFTDLEEDLDRTLTGPPRLSSELLPHLAPMYASPNGLDPAKSVFGPNGELVDGYERLPGIALGADGGGHRYTS